jgi:hypothetical protein
MFGLKNKNLIRFKRYLKLNNNYNLNIKLEINITLEKNQFIFLKIILYIPCPEYEKMI